MLAGAATPGLGQEPGHRLSLDVSGGAVVPIRASAKVSSTGFGLALGLNHRLGRRLSLITEFQESLMSGGGSNGFGESTEINLSRVALGIEARLNDPGASWSIRSRLSVGLTRVGSNPFPGSSESRLGLAKFNTDAFTLVGGIQLGYGRSRLSPFARIQAEVYFVGGDLGLLQGIDETIGDSGPLLSIPIQAGLRIGL